MRGMPAMIVDWIYNSPTWLWGTVFVFVCASVACLGLTVFHRLVRVEIRRAHNELAGFTVAVVAVVYAVLLAFIAVATWESFSDAQGLVDNEADYVGNIYRDTQGLPLEVGQTVRDDLTQYVAIVIRQEWPLQRQGKTPEAGWAPLHRLHNTIITFQPQTRGQAVIQAELLRTLNELYKARESRLSAVEGHVPFVIWWIIFFGGGLVVIYTYLFGFHDFRMHLVMTTVVTTSLALVVVLIISLDWPFRGAVSITPEPFVKTRASWGTPIR
jgi:hypothetical protein